MAVTREAIGPKESNQPSILEYPVLKVTTLICRYFFNTLGYVEIFLEKY